MAFVSGNWEKIVNVMAEGKEKWRNHRKAVKGFAGTWPTSLLLTFHWPK